MLRQRLSEGVPLLGVFGRVLETDPRRRGAAGRHGQPLAVEIVHDDLEAPALLAEQVSGGDAAIVEMQRRGVRGPPAHFLQRRPRKARRIALDHQQADAAGTGTAGAHRGGDVIGAHARGDEGLLAVDDIEVAVAARRGAQIGDVGAAARLGDRERRYLLARQNFRQHPRLEFRAAGARDRRRADRIALQAGADAAGPGPRQFLDSDDPHEIVDFGAAIFLRESPGPAARFRRPSRRARGETRPPRPTHGHKARSPFRQSGAPPRDRPRVRRCRMGLPFASLP